MPGPSENGPAQFRFGLPLGAIGVGSGLGLSGAGRPRDKAVPGSAAGAGLATCAGKELGFGGRCSNRASPAGIELANWAREWLPRPRLLCFHAIGASTLAPRPGASPLALRFPACARSSGGATRRGTQAECAGSSQMNKAFVRDSDADRASNALP